MDEWNDNLKNLKLIKAVEKLIDLLWDHHPEDYDGLLTKDEVFNFTIGKKYISVMGGKGRVCYVDSLGNVYPSSARYIHSVNRKVCLGSVFAVTDKRRWGKTIKWDGFKLRAERPVGTIRWIK